MVLLSAVLAVSLARVASRDMSVTTDEFGYLPDGLGWLAGQKPRVPEGNPPVFKVLSALPVLWAPHEYHSEWIREGQGFWQIGASFMRANEENYHTLFLRARTVPLVFLALTCVLASWLAWQLYGKGAAVVAAWLTALNPNVLAHGALVTPDIFFTAATLCVVIAVVSHVRRPSYLHAGGVGAAVAAACLFKLTGVLIVFVLWVWSLMARRAAGGRNELAWCRNRYRLAAAGTLWIVMCSAYCFEDVGARFRDMDLRSRALTRLLPAIGALPSPLPAHLVRTVDYQINDSHLPAYLDGRVNTRGFFDYYLRAIVYKSPPALLVLVALSLLVGRVQLKERPLLVVGLGLLILFSLLRFKNIGIRYVLCLYPLMSVWIGRLVADADEAWVSRLRVRKALAIIVVSAGIVGLAASEWRIWPHHLAYFSSIAGGPEGGPEHLVDSNIDWGQDLILLERFMRGRGIDQIDLAYFGRVDPGVYGIRRRVFDGGPRQRWAAASVTVLFALSQFRGAPEAYRQLVQLEPVSRLGYSIYVYDMTRARARGSPGADGR